MDFGLPLLGFALLVSGCGDQPPPLPTPLPYRAEVQQQLPATMRVGEEARLAITVQNRGPQIPDLELIVSTELTNAALTVLRVQPPPVSSRGEPPSSALEYHFGPLDADKSLTLELQVRARTPGRYKGVSALFEGDHQRLLLTPSGQYTQPAFELTVSN